MRSDKSSENKPWILVFNWNDPLGRVFLTDEEAEIIRASMDKKIEQLELNKQVLPLKYAILRSNPDYFDPIQQAKLKKAIQKQEEYLKSKRDKELFDD